MSRPAGLLAALLVVASTAAFADPAPADRGPADRGPADPAALTWRCLEFHATVGSTKICIDPAKPTQLAEHWHHPQAVRAPTSAGALYTMTLETEAVGNLTREAIFFEPSRATLVQRTRVRLGSKGNRKSYRLDGDRLHVYRRGPNTREERDGPESGWSKHEHSEFPVPQSGCPVLSEAALLIYLVSAHDWSGPPLPELCVFARKGWSRVKVVNEGEQDLEASWQEGSRRRTIKRALSIRFQAEPLAGQEEVELLGLSGDLRLWLDPVSRLPVLIQGKYKVFPVDVELASVEPR